VTETELLSVVKGLVVLMATNEMAKTEDSEIKLAALRESVETHLHADAPMAQLGWDSVQMTWLLVRLEERYDIDTSTLSMFEMFTVGDLLRSLVPLINERGSARG
jgi:acyl carrier protein